MSLTLIQKGRRTPQSVSEASQLDGPWYERDGSLVATPWELAMANAGKVFIATAGTITTPATFAAGSITVTTPDFDLALPVGSSVKVVLLEIAVTNEAYGTTAIFEGMASIGLGGVISNGTAVTPACTRLDGGTSACSAVYVGTATYMTSKVSEIFRFGQSKAAAVGTATDSTTWQQTTQRWSARDAGVYPILVAASAVARLNVFSCSQAGTGFIRVIWAELPLDQ